MSLQAVMNRRFQNYLFAVMASYGCGGGAVFADDQFFENPFQNGECRWKNRPINYKTRQDPYLF